MSKCKVCKCEYTKTRPMQTVCGFDCSMTLAREKREREEAKKVREQNALDRKKREELKTLPVLKKEAQREFNRWIRARDYGKPCISCGSDLLFGGVGGRVDGGHYRSVGSAPHLRFEETNVHAQCVHCNRWGSGRAVEYRIGLLARIGQAALDKLEADQTPRHYTRDDLREIRDTYRKRANELEKARNADDRTSRNP